MRKVEFYGWQKGVRKIHFIRLLNEVGGLSLKESKSIKDRLIDNSERIVVEFKDDETAKKIVEISTTYCIKCCLVK